MVVCDILDETNLLQMACFASKMIYKDSFEILKEHGFKMFVKKNISYGVLETDTLLILVFKGTSTFRDFLVDINFAQTDDIFEIPGLVHKGFYSSLVEDGLIFNIIRDVTTFRNTHTPQKQFIITGHSMGGALACIFYAILSKFTEKFSTNTPKPFLVTFGAPKCGDLEFSSYLYDYAEYSYTRVINGSDIVTKLPMACKYVNDKRIRVFTLKSNVPFISSHHSSNYLRNITQFMCAANKHNHSEQ